VSYPAPTYYAHLVAARGKNYIVTDDLDMRRLDQEYKRREIRPEFINNSPMFFV
jgi:eukaryotic translation initiation factor 2C